MAKRVGDGLYQTKTVAETKIFERIDTDHNEQTVILTTLSHMPERAWLPRKRTDVITGDEPTKPVRYSRKHGRGLRVHASGAGTLYVRGDIWRSMVLISVGTGLVLGAGIGLGFITLINAF